MMTDVLCSISHMNKQRLDRILTGRPSGRRKRPEGIPRRASDRISTYEQWAYNTCVRVGRPACSVKVEPKDSSEVLLTITGELGHIITRDLDKLTPENELNLAVESVLEELPSRVLFPGPRPFVPINSKSSRK